MSAIKKIRKEIKWVSVGDIRCHPLNPRKNSKSAKIVAKSIQEYGYINPIVVDEEGTILAGNTRFKALQLLGVEEFDVLVVSGLTDEEKVGFWSLIIKLVSIPHGIIQAFNVLLKNQATRMR